MLNVVAIMGRLVADPELRTTQSGTNVCSFRIACDRNFARQGEQRQADFIDIVAWRQQAEFVSKYFQKGSLIAIEGSLQTRQYQDKNGNNRTAVEVVANNVNFAGSKSNGSNQGGGSYQNAAPSYQNAAPARPAAVEAAPSYSAGNADDFAVIDDSDDPILLLEDEEDCYRFFEDVCTVNEIHAIAQRLQVAKLLSEDKTYSEIEAVTKASTATISRINKCLVYGADGYKRILQRLADEDKD